MTTKYNIICYFWAPNGTNDIAIVDAKTGQEIDGLDEALFGVNLKHETAKITLETALNHIAVSPIEDGSRTINFLKQYFKLPTKE
jgi:hypothetical protein